MATGMVLTNGALADMLAAATSIGQAEPGMFEAGVLHGILGSAAQPNELDTPLEAWAYAEGYTAGRSALEAQS